jgi:hypothetical protein
MIWLKAGICGWLAAVGKVVQLWVSKSAENFLISGGATLLSEGALLCELAIIS